VSEPKYPIVDVNWLDSVQLNGNAWMNVDDVAEHLTEKGLLHRSVGFLVGTTDTAVAVARSVSEWDDAVEKAEGVLIIPRAAIIEIRGADIEQGS